MIYILDNIVTFNDKSGAFSNIEFPQQKVTLSTTGCMIFTLLVTNAGRIVSRNELLDAVWESRGLNPSNSSLNQYLSIIRKALIESGCDNEIIHTKLKEGFIIPTEHVRHEVEEASPPPTTRRTTKRQRPLIYVAICAMAIVSIVSFTFYKSTHLPIFQPAERFPIGYINSCKVYALRNLTNKNKDVAMEYLNGIVANDSYRIPCQSKSFYLINNEHAYTNITDGRMFVSQCYYKDDNMSKISQCYSVYKHED